jgi:hypothetical protein
MSVYLNAKDAIYGLHKKGYVFDFSLAGNDLLWVQEKQLVRAGDFIITEYYLFSRRQQSKNGLIIFGVHDLSTNLKGILIRHYTGQGLHATPVVGMKVNEILCYCHEEH